MPSPSSNFGMGVKPTMSNGSANMMGGGGMMMQGRYEILGYMFSSILHKCNDFLLKILS